MQDKKKLDPRCTKGVFVGYDKDSPAYLVYFPEIGKVLKYRVVKFVTKDFGEQQTQTEGLSDSDYESWGRRSPISSSYNVNPVEQTATSSTEREVGTDLQSNGSTEQPTPSRRERKPPAYLKDCVTNIQESSEQVLGSVDYCYKLSGFPETYQEAMESPDAEYWRVAMEEEIDSLIQNETFTLTTLPNNRSVVGWTMGIHH